MGGEDQTVIMLYVTDIHLIALNMDHKNILGNLLHYT